MNTKRFFLEKTFFKVFSNKVHFLETLIFKKIWAKNDYLQKIYHSKISQKTAFLLIYEDMWKTIFEEKAFFKVISNKVHFLEVRSYDQKQLLINMYFSKSSQDMKKLIFKAIRAKSHFKVVVFTKEENFKKKIFFQSDFNIMSNFWKIWYLWI